MQTSSFTTAVNHFPPSLGRKATGPFGPWILWLQTLPNQICPPIPLSVSLAMHRLCKSTLWATHLPRSNHSLLRANTVHLTKKPLHITRDYQISLRSSRYHQEPPHQTKKPPHQTRKQPHLTMYRTTTSH